MSTNGDYLGFPYYSNISKEIREELTRRQELAKHNLWIPDGIWTSVISGVTIDKNISPEGLKNWGGATTFEFNNGLLTSDKDYESMKADRGIKFLEQATHLSQDWKEWYNLNFHGRNMRPTLQSIRVENLSKHGGVRKITLELSVPNMQVFNDMIPFFSTPGRSLLVQWGRSNDMGLRKRIYLDEVDHIFNREAYQSDKKYESQPSDQFTFNANNSGYKFWQLSVESHGNWDGAIGLITNFNWSMQSNLSWRLNVELNSISALVYGVNLAQQAIQKTKTG
jgi:hypothetical protein